MGHAKLVRENDRDKMTRPQKACRVASRLCIAGHDGSEAMTRRVEKAKCHNEWFEAGQSGCIPSTHARQDLFPKRFQASKPTPAPIWKSRPLPWLGMSSADGPNTARNPGSSSRPLRCGCAQAAKSGRRVAGGFRKREAIPQLGVARPALTRIPLGDAEHTRIWMVVRCAPGRCTDASAATGGVQGGLSGVAGTAKQAESGDGGCTRVPAKRRVGLLARSGFAHRFPRYAGSWLMDGTRFEAG